MRPPISFFVAGLPKPAGSKRGFFIPKLNRVAIVDACKGSKDWKVDVKHEAQAKYSGDPWDCPIALRLTFFMPRPKGHFRTGKHASMLRNSAPFYPLTKPDVLKLARGVEDALTGIIYKDDCLIVEEHLFKKYAHQPGVAVELTEVTI